jgi:hypothetical protein
VNRILWAALLLGSATAAGAQVGYDPQHSPYRDRDQSYEWSFLYGHYTARPDPAGVAPQGGDLFGLLYGWHAGGPVYLTTDLTRIASQRLVLDPAVPELKRQLGVAYWPLFAAEGGMEVSFTGPRTFHGFMPLADLGLGLLSDRHTRSDVGEFSFGTRFEFTWGASLRYIATDRWAMRADLKYRFFSMGYPETYYKVASDSTSVVTATQAKSFWRMNPSLSIGLSYMPWR